MDLNELINDLRNILPPKVDYADLVCAEGGSYGMSYVWEDPEPYFIERAANALERLTEENKQLRNDLIMQTALAQNGRSAIETNKQLSRKFEALLEDFKELVLNPDDECKYCKYNQPCYGKECESYIEGNEAWDHKGCKHDWEWSCKDFNFGECPKLENTPCNSCIKNNMSGFEWRGVECE